MKKIFCLALTAFVSFGVMASDTDSSNCSFKGKDLWGRVQIVENGADFKVMAVQNGANLKVETVKDNPSKCGQWQKVDDNPDFTVEFTENNPDFTVEFVMPGRG